MINTWIYRTLSEQQSEIQENQEDDKIKQNFDGNKSQMGQVILIPLAFFMILFICA